MTSPVLTANRTNSWISGDRDSRRGGQSGRPGLSPHRGPAKRYMIGPPLKTYGRSSKTSESRQVMHGHPNYASCRGDAEGRRWPPIISRADGSGAVASLDGRGGKEGARPGGPSCRPDRRYRRSELDRSRGGTNLTALSLPAGRPPRLGRGLGGTPRTAGGFRRSLMADAREGYDGPIGV